MNKTIGFGALWTAAAAGAVGLGFIAVSLVDTAATPGTSPAAATGSTAGSPTAASSSASTGDDSSAPSSGPTAGTTTPGAPAPSSTSSTSSPVASSGQQDTVAGSVIASCADGVLSLASAPAAGWWLDDSQDPGEVEFENATQKLEVKVVCAGGVPSFVVEGPRADDNGGGDDDDNSGSGSGDDDSGDTPDDSDGRPGGGHGSDD